MTDIVERLRDQGKDAFSKHYSLGMFKLCDEAAGEIERLRGALEAIRNTSGYDNILFTGASAAICSRMADIHQHANSALPMGGAR